MKSLDDKLAMRLTRLQLASEERIREATNIAEGENRSLASVLVERGWADDRAVARQVARLNGMEFLDLETFVPDRIVLRLLRPTIANRCRAVPVGLVDETLVIAVADPDNIVAIDEVRAVTARPIRTVLVTERAMEIALERFFSVEAISSEEEVVDDAPPRLDPPAPHDAAPENMSMLGDTPPPRRDPETIHSAPTAISTPDRPDDMGKAPTWLRAPRAAATPKAPPTSRPVWEDAASTIPMAPEEFASLSSAIDGEQVHPPNAVPDRNDEPTRVEDSTLGESSAEHSSFVDASPSSGGSHDEHEEAPVPPPSRTDISTFPTRIVALHELSTVREGESSSEIPQMDSGEVRIAPGVELVSQEVRLPDFDSQLDIVEAVDGEPGVSELLRQMIEGALSTGAEELELAPPSVKKTRARIRKLGNWHDLLPYAVKYHDPLIRRLRLLANAPAESTGTIECRFHLESRRGPILAIASFTPTIRGDRCVVRFPENIPLIQHPLRILGVEPALVDTFEERLRGGGGLIFVTAQNPRLSDQLLASILHEIATQGSSAMLLEPETDRVIPGVTQVDCADEDALDAALETVRVSRPDLVGIARITSADQLKKLISLALVGQSSVACFVAPSPKLAHAALRASGVDPLQLTVGLIAHVHLSQVPRLCGRCREAMGPARRLPDWASQLESVRLYEAKGCAACNDTGRKGSSWVTEVYIPDPDGGPELLTRRSRTDSLTQLSMEAWLDPRDVRH